MSKENAAPNPNPTTAAPAVTVDLAPDAAVDEAGKLVYLKWGKTTPVGQWIDRISPKKAGELVTPILASLAAQWPAILAAGGFTCKVEPKVKAG